MPKASGGWVPDGSIHLDREDGPELVVPLIGEASPEPFEPEHHGCQQADGCPFQGGHWLRHTDKAGERTTRFEADGAFWNRSCPVNGCPIRVYA